MALAPPTSTYGGRAAELRGELRADAHPLGWASAPSEKSDAPLFRATLHAAMEHSSHAKLQEALVGALEERDLVNQLTVGADRKGKGGSPRSRKKTRLSILSSSCRLRLLRLRLTATE